MSGAQVLPDRVIVAWDLDETIADLMPATRDAWVGAGGSALAFSKLPFDFLKDPTVEPELRAFVSRLWADAAFWRDLPPSPLYPVFLEALTMPDLEHVIVTSPWRGAFGACVQGKHEWCEKHAPGVPVIFAKRKEFIEADVFIDDRLENHRARYAFAKRRRGRMPTMGIVPMSEWTPPPPSTVYDPEIPSACWLTSDSVLGALRLIVNAERREQKLPRLR